MVQRRDELLDADYDGIQEYDNAIPLWLNLTFAGSIVFAVIYVVYYHIAGVGRLPVAEYQAEVAAAQAAQAEQAARQPALDLAALLADPAARSEGGQVFAQNCAACHGQNLEGLIGPNLVDATWIHGDGSVAAVAAVVADGVLEKGMPAWASVLGAEKVGKVAAFIVAARGSDAAPAAAPAP